MTLAPLPSIPRRDFFKVVGLTAAAQTAASSTQVARASEPPDTKPFTVDCQSHLFFPEVLDMMRGVRASHGSMTREALPT